MDELKQENPGGTPSGPCKCKALDVSKLPNDKQPFRRLLEALSQKLKELAKEPTEATNKFTGDLKDAEKEYQGIEPIVAKYKEFYDKQLDCKLSDARRWRDSIVKWSTIDDRTKKAIRDFRTENYDQREELICCKTWLFLKNQLNGSSDCLVQATNKEAQNQASYDLLKGFVDTLTKIFGDLKTLFEKAEAFNKEGKPKLVYAVSLEFDALFKLIDWPRTPEEECWKKPETGDTGYQSTPPAEGGYAEQTGGGYEEQETYEESQGEEEAAQYDGLKKKLSPDKFRARLLAALRQLLLAKYHRFLLHHVVLSLTVRAEAAKKECEKFKAERQKLFLEEVEDIPIDTSGTGGGGGGTGSEGYEEQTPTGGYQPENPGGGGYQQEPPTGGYQQEPPTGGYQPETPSGGYEKPSTGGGYQKRPK
jgi:hypothetical protein